jgi:hypothetical protein
MYLLKLEGLIDATEKVREAASSTERPEVIQGSGEEEEEEDIFCCVNGKEKHAITLWLRAQNSNFHPTFIRLPGKAEKDLSAHSAYPTLGLDSTLPQYRPAAHDTVFLPKQDEYPIW